MLMDGRIVMMLPMEGGTTLRILRSQSLAYRHHHRHPRGWQPLTHAYVLFVLE